MADLFVWSDGLSVGIQEIDEQHKELVNLLNQLHRAVGEKLGAAAARTVLDELVEYTQAHFMLEESLMRASNYPDFAAHHKSHEGLMSQVRELQDALDVGEAEIGSDLLKFLKGWLVGHINESDKRFGEHLLGSGGAAAWSPQIQEIMRGKLWWKFW